MANIELSVSNACDRNRSQSARRPTICPSPVRSDRASQCALLSTALGGAREGPDLLFAVDRHRSSTQELVRVPPGEPSSPLQQGGARRCSTWQEGVRPGFIASAFSPADHICKWLRAGSRWYCSWQFYCSSCRHRHAKSLYLVRAPRATPNIAHSL
jgi:hypothetical protein